MGQSLAIPRVIPEDWKRLDLIINKIKMRLGRDASPTWAGLTLIGNLSVGGNLTVDGAFYLKDLLTEYYLHLLVAETNLTADRFLVIDVNNADRRLDITGDSTINQDVSTVGSPVFANLSLGTGELTTGSINRGAGTLTLEIAGTAEISISSTTVTLGGNLVIPDTGYIGSASDPNAIRIAASGEVTFTDVATGILPTTSAHLATKEYVDLAIGSSKDYFLSDNDDAIPNYHILYETDTGEAASTLTTDPAMNEGDDQLMFSFITASGVPGVTFLRAGIYILHTHLSRGTGDKPTTFYWTLSKRTTEDDETVLITKAMCEESTEIPDSTITFRTHAILASDTAIGATDRLVLKLYANVGAAGGVSEVTIHMEGTHNCHLTNLLPSSIWQTQGDMLDAINALGDIADNEFLVGTGAGTLAWESGATLRTSMGLAIGTDVQAWDTQLDDIAALAVTDGNFIVGDGTNWVAESGATVRTSLGLGTGDSPLFTAVSIGNVDTTITRVSAGVIAVEGTTVMLAGDAPAAHSIASHNDTTGTGAELNTLTDGSDAGALHSHAAAYQPLDIVLTDLAALAAVADNEFIVGNGAGSYAHENPATAATSMGLGTGDSPTFSNLTVTNTFSITDLLATGDTQLGNNIALDTVGINVTPDADVLIKGSFVSTGSGDTFCYNDELFTHAEDDSTANTFIYGTNSVMSVNDDLTVNGTFTAIGHRQSLEAGTTTITGINNPTAYLYGYHAVVDWAAAALTGATYAACVVGFKADVTGNLGTTGNTIKWGADISVSESAVTNYGGRFTAQGATYNYGLWGYATGAHTTNYGLYGYAAAATTNWGLYIAAGNAYFAGNITIAQAYGHAFGASSPGDGWGDYRGGIITATGGWGIIWQTDNTLTASANNDTLQGIRVTPSFNRGAYTDITGHCLYLWGDGGAGEGNEADYVIYAPTDQPSYIEGSMGIGTIPTAKFHVDQSAADGAIPVVRLDQGDIDDSFIDFIGTSAADGSRSISSDITENSAKFGAIRVEINGVTKWIRIYDDES